MATSSSQSARRRRPPHWITANAMTTTTGPNEASAAWVAGKVTLKHSTPSAPSSIGDAFQVSTEVLLLALMNDDSSQVSARSAVEDLIGSLPPDSKLPSLSLI